MGKGDIEPVLRPREAAGRSYDRLSRWYDLIAASEQAFVDEGLTMLDASPGERVIEIGFGTGRALIEIARRVDRSGSVCGIDLSTEMVERSRRRIKDAGFGQRVALTAGDAVHLPYADRAFDAVFMSFTLDLFAAEEIASVLGECLRVLRPGGRIAVVSLEKGGFSLASVRIRRMWGMPVELVLAERRAPR